MTTEDSLFPPSPTGNELQKLGDDDMYPAVMADPLLGEESLFNDSLDDVHVHEKAIRAALTDVEKTADNEREHNLDDSLDYDMTQLPFDDVVGESGLNTNLISRGSSNQGDAVNSKSTSGFQVAVQIPMSSTCDDGGTSEVTDSKSSATDVSKAVKDTTDDHHQKTPQDQQQMEKSTHTSDTSTVKNSAPSDSRVSKSSKLVPSFGRRKNKTTLSPPTKVDTKKEAHVELDKQTSSVAGSCQTTEKEDTSGEETLQEGDQCVPETTARVENPSNTFAGNNIRKNKQNATSGERERNMSDNKELGQNTSSTSAISRKEKKLTAAREQKKQEKEEKRKEAERKKLEREKKKKEAEEKKAEKERLKKERQLELERKRAEREQKKIQQVLKKAESKDGKQSSKRTKKANKENGGSNDEIITESTPVSQSKSKGDISMSATQLDIEMEDADQSNGNKNINENMQSECGGVTQPQENASLPDTSKSLQPCSESLGMNGAGREGELKEQSTADLPLESAEMEEGCSMAREDLEEVEQGEGNGEPLDDARDPASTADLPLESAEMEEGCSMAREDLEEVEQGEGNGEPLDDARDPASHDKENDGKNKISAHNNEPQSKRIKIVFGPTSKNAQKKTESSRVNSLKENGDVSKTKTAVNVGITKSIPKAVSAAKPKKTPGSAAAKKKPASKGTISTTSNPKAAKLKQMKRTRPQGSKVEPESKRSKPANYTGPVWVQCERSSCKKWRQLRDCTDPLSLPESWNCTMNTDKERSSCSAPEEQWSDDVGDSQEYVESPFIPGSLVWAKLDRYPWWPAMVEEDPNEETYYEMGKMSTSSIPVKYHVVFFDTPVSRGWVSNFHIHPYAEDEDYNTTSGTSVSQKLRRNLKEARKQANRAMTMTIAMRLNECSFSKRFRRMASRKRKAQDDSVSDSSFSSTVKISRGGGHRSARLSRAASKLQREEGGEGEGDEERDLEGGKQSE